jgi:hypothetical protein
MGSTATDPTEESIQKCLHQDSQANIIWVNNILQMIYGHLLIFYSYKGHPKRGVALIFNHEHFDISSLKSR